MFKSKPLLTITMCALLLTTTGCFTDKKEASKANFEKVAQAYYSQKASVPACVKLPVGEVQFVLWYGGGKADGDAIVVRDKSPDDLKLATLQKAGLMTREARPVVQGVETFRYRFTEKAKQMQSEKNLLCYGTQTFSGVKTFTEPAVANGKKITEVTLLWKVQDVADWMQDKQTQALWLGKEFDINGLRETKKTFVLMGDGWSID